MQTISINRQSVEALSTLVVDIFDGPRQVTFTPTGLVFIQLGGLQTGEIYPDIQKRVDPHSLDSRFILRRGDVLLSKTGEAPRAALVSAELSGATLSPDIYCFRAKSDLVSPAWLTYFLNSNPIREKLAKSVYGKTTARLHLPDLRSIPVVLPPKEITQEIDQLEELAQQHSQAARDIWSATLRGLFTEIDDRLGFDTQDEGKISGNFPPPYFSNMDGNEILSALDKPHEGLAIVPLSQVAQIAVSSRKNFDPDQVVQYVQTSDIDPNYFLFRNIRSGKVRDLPARIRQPIQAFQVLLLASGSNLGFQSHPVAIIRPELDGCLASNTFLALEFHETPIYYGMVLKHPVVLAQIRQMAVGKVICLIRKKDVAQLKIPILGPIWRQDFNDRARMAWERRSIAKQLRTQAAQKVDAFLRQIGLEFLQ